MAASSSSGLPTITSAFRRSRRRPPSCHGVSEMDENRWERSSLLIELQGSLILVNVSVLPGRLKVYLPGLRHVTGEPDGTAGCANVIVVPEMVYVPLASFSPLRKSVSVPA